MGAKTWMIAYSDAPAGQILKSRPRLDRAGAQQLAAKLFPQAKLQAAEDGRLTFTSPGRDQLYVGCFPGLSIVAASELAVDLPSKLPRRFLDAAGQRTVSLHVMHSVVDWFAYAVWERGTLVRSLSLSSDSGVMEDIGQRQAFEIPFWAGEHPVDDEYPLPFHPLELGEEALFNLFGYRLEGPVADVEFEPDEVALAGFKLGKPWWKLW